MTSPPPGYGPGHNPFDPPGYQVYGGGGDDNPLTNPAMFVRPAPPPPRRSALRDRLTRFATVAGVFVLLAACCVGFRFLGITGADDDKPKRSAATGSPTPTRSTASPSATRTYSPPPYSAPPATTAPATPSLDNVQKGQCLKNNGTNEDPDMVPAPCGKGTYQVLARYSGYIDVVCQSVPGYTTSYVVTYYRNGIPDSLRSYVLCLKRR